MYLYKFIIIIIIIINYAGCKFLTFYVSQRIY
jgi:hypothetical protein